MAYSVPDEAGFVINEAEGFINQMEYLERIKDTPGDETWAEVVTWWKRLCGEFACLVRAAGREVE